MFAIPYGKIYRYTQRDKQERTQDYKDANSYAECALTDKHTLIYIQTLLQM